MPYKDYNQALEYAKRYNKESYYFCKSINICTKCHNESAMNGFTLCPECSARKLDQDKKYYQRNKAECIKRRTEQKKERITKGICISCANPVCATSKRFCDYHRRLENEYQKKRRREKGIISRDIALARGLCIRCLKQKAISNHTYCQDCYDSVKKKFIETAMPKAIIIAKQNHWSEGVYT